MCNKQFQQLGNTTFNNINVTITYNDKMRQTLTSLPLLLLKNLQKIYKEIWNIKLLLLLM